MLTSGFCILDRGILKYFKKPFSENEAWIWMITQADYKNGDTYGKVFVTTRELSETWGRGIGTVSRWLKKWTHEPNARIACKYATINRVSLHNICGTQNGTQNGTCRTEITLLNYKIYQQPKKKHGTQNGTHCGTQNGTFLKEEEKNLKKKNSTPLPPKGGKAKASHDIEFLKKELQKLDLSKFHDTYSPQGLNVDLAYEDMESYVLKGNAKKPRPNPANWIDFNLAFHDKCKWCLEHGRFMKKADSLEDW